MSQKDLDAYNDSMASTLTIRNLDETVKQRLRVRAAEHGRSMEAEVRDILLKATQEAAPERRSLDGLVGLWKDRLSTDQVMSLTRGE